MRHRFPIVLFMSFIFSPLLLSLSLSLGLGLNFNQLMTMTMPMAHADAEGDSISEESLEVDQELLINQKINKENLKKIQSQFTDSVGENIPQGEDVVNGVANLQPLSDFKISFGPINKFIKNLTQEPNYLPLMQEMLKNEKKFILFRNVSIITLAVLFIIGFFIRPKNFFKNIFKKLFFLVIQLLSQATNFYIFFPKQAQLIGGVVYRTFVN
jgi:hypothetical protein